LVVVESALGSAQPTASRAEIQKPGRHVMLKWKSPRVVELSCGSEINAYFPAEL
jgi:coenzyme PQQ precursor peptide PqqA